MNIKLDSDILTLKKYAVNFLGNLNFTNFTFNKRQLLISLVGPVYGHVQDRILLQAGQGQTVLRDQLTSLKSIYFIVFLNTSS